MKVEIQAPEEFQGSVVGQINQRRGIILEHRDARRLRRSIDAEVPLNDMFGYSTDLRSATQGKGEFTMEFAKYAGAEAGAGSADGRVQEESAKKKRAGSRSAPQARSATIVF